mgnify:CR=1 FL=1
MSVCRALRWLAAPLLWFVHFNLLYGVVTVGSALRWSADVVAVTSWALTIGAALTIVAILLSLRRRRDRDEVWRIAWAVGLLSLVAVLLQALVLSLMAT